jgi:hypothetical protein
MGDIITLRGSLEYVLRNALTGEIVQQGKSHNLVVSAGRQWMLNRLGSTDSNVIDRIKLGTGTTAPATTQTDLANSFSSKTAATVSAAGTTASPPYFSFSASWASNETHSSSSAINELGLFAANGTMVGRLTTTPTINFGNTNTLAITYNLSN